jgi:hypothetical protein
MSGVVGFTRQRPVQTRNRDYSQIKGRKELVDGLAELLADVVSIKSPAPQVMRGSG